MTNQSGIYKIISKSNIDKIYIGSALHLRNRKNEHFRRLKSGVHPNKILLNHFNKYGIDDLDFVIIEQCNKVDLIAKEQQYIDLLDPYFNICKIAASTIGRPQSLETRRKRSISSIGRKMSEESRKLMSEAAEKRNPIPHEKSGYSILKKIGNASNRSRIFRCQCLNCGIIIEKILIDLRVCKCLIIKNKTTKVKIKKKKSEYKTPSNVTGYCGVSYRNDKDMYMARVSTIYSKQKFLGYFNTAIEAAIARNSFIIDNKIDAKINNINY